MAWLRQCWRTVTAADVRRERETSRDDRDRARRRLERCVYHADQAAKAAEKVAQSRS